MSKTKYHKERVNHPSSCEKRFENLLLKYGFEIIGYRELISKTWFLISKGRHQMEYEFPHNKFVNEENYFNICCSLFDNAVKYNMLKEIKK